MSALDPSLAGIRRVEAPVLVDRRGTAWALGLIDVTLRFGERTVLAEAPPPELRAELARSLREAAVRFAGAKGKAGAFTVSFLADPAQGEHRFTGTVAGLPACVALLESLSEVDLPALEAHLSRGGTLEGGLPEPRGVAMQVSLLALDPEDGFAPRAGSVESLRLPAGAGLRADPGIEEGSVPAAPELLVARITAHGRTRAEALARLQRGVAATEVAVHGGTTDKAFLSEILDRPELAGGDAEPGWLDRLVAAGDHLPRRGAEVALLVAAIDRYEAEWDAARSRFYESASRGRLEVPPETASKAELRHRGHPYVLHLARAGHDLFRIAVDGRVLEVRAGLPGRTGRSLACGEKSWRVSLVSQENRQLVEVDGIPHRVEQDAGESLQGAVERRVRFDGLEAAPEAILLDEIRRLVLGYDVEPESLQRLLAQPAGAAGGHDPLREEEILWAFVDVAALFRRQPGDGDRQSPEEHLYGYLRSLRGSRDADAGGTGLPAGFRDQLRHALAHYGVGSLERGPDLEESLFRIAISHHRLAQQVAPMLALLERCLERGERPDGAGSRELLERVITETQGTAPAVHDLAREVRYRLFDRPVVLAARERIYAAAEADLARLAESPGAEERARLVRSLVDCIQPLHRVLSQRFESASPAVRPALLEVMVRRYYRIRELREISLTTTAGQDFAVATYDYKGSHVHLIATHTAHQRLRPSLEAVRTLALQAQPGSEIVADLYFSSSGSPANATGEDAAAAEISSLLAALEPPGELRRLAVTISFPQGMQSFTFRRSAGDGDAFREERVYRGIHPMMALRLELWRLQNFQLERLPSPEEIYFFRGVAHENLHDERLFAIAEVRDLTPVKDAAGRVVYLPQLEHVLMESLAGIRRFQARRAPGERLQWNRVLLYAWPPVDLGPEELNALVHRLAPLSAGLGLEKVAVRCRVPDPQGGELRERVLEISNLSQGGTVLRFRRPKEAPLKPLREYAQKVVDLRRRGLPYPYEVVKLLVPPRRDAQAELPAGDFVEHDLDGSGHLVPVDRPYGNNTAAVVVGVVRNFTARYPEGMARVIVLGDPSRGMGAVAEPECRRILAALDLAREMGVPLEWFALSAGTGGEESSEILDWTARVLRRLVELTQAGLEVNVVVMGINAGAQPLWNAAAAMLMQTRGIVIMIPGSSMVLGAPGEDDQGTGGYERILGPNGEAQYSAPDLAAACRTLLRHYEHTYAAPGERFPRPAATCDRRDRDVSAEITYPNGEKPCEIRPVMAAVADQDHEPLERWYGMRDAEVAVVWDAHLGGHPVCLLGFESQSLPRLFPLAAKKVARAIDAASGSRPLVVLSNLSGFDGSPASMRQGQLEFLAEIGRAVVSFDGPIVLCALSRCQGGACVLFSAALHDNLEIAVLAGAPGEPADCAHTVIAPGQIRPWLIAAVERGISRAVKAS
ncbi:MAG TPA: carboxyl transferase domain-containing protein [Thermoanaerobaculia bacterium]|nr:carboxyl transferase domain-containing protein [Thermoanaerobaculia bacterium]